MDLSFWTLQFLNAMQYSMLLFLLSIGLTVIFGLLHFVNLAHASLYMMGAYIGISVAALTGSFWAAFFLAPVIVTLIGAMLYFTLIDRMRTAGPMNQVLVTFGLIFIFLDLVRMGWGDIALGLDGPQSLSGTTRFLGVDYPAYRLFIIALGLGVMTTMWFILSRTQIGVMIRASVENTNMAAAMGINVSTLFFLVFCFGCALAGLAGVAAAPILSATTTMGITILIPTLIVVVIGGLGSLEGAIAGSIIIGFMETFGAVMIPSFSAVLTYVLLAVVLIWRPQGLIPARG